MRNPLTIGVVEDNDDLRDSLVELLGRQGHRVFGASSAEELADSALPLPFSLVLLDLNLPGEDGLSLAVRLKRVNPRLRVIMMTTRTSLSDRVLGYEWGADLYLPKPVAEEELLAAVHSMARQMGGDDAGAVESGGGVLLLVPHALELCGPSGTVRLNAREEALLRALAHAPGHRLEYWQLLQCLNLDLDDSGKQTLAVTVTRLRAKLLQVGSTNHALRSLRSTGYQLCVPLRIHASEGPAPLVSVNKRL